MLSLIKIQDFCVAKKKSTVNLKSACEVFCLDVGSGTKTSKKPRIHEDASGSAKALHIYLFIQKLQTNNAFDNDSYLLIINIVATYIMRHFNIQ